MLSYLKRGVIILHDRIKELRRAFDLTQEAFAARIGVKRAAISNYEIGRNIPTDAVVSLICREFNVSERWLRTGEGEMFAPAPSSALDALAAERGLSRRDYILIEKFLTLRPAVRSELIDFLLQVAAAINSGEASSGELVFPAARQADALDAEGLHAELERQISLEKEAADKSEVS